MASKFRIRLPVLYAKSKSAIGLARRKVFCIGFNKTGTSSLHHFFRSVGLTSTHNTRWPSHSQAQHINRSLFYHQCYSDGEKSDFIALDTAFPNSLFILNNRNERDWLYSRIKHVMRYNEQFDALNILSDKRVGWMARDFFFDEKLAIRKWVCERRIYILQARQYFNNRSDFLELDVTSSERWQIELLDFFETNVFPTKRKAPGSGVLHINRRDSNDIYDQSLLSKYENLIDGILADIDR